MIVERIRDWARAHGLGRREVGRADKLRAELLEWVHTHPEELRGPPIQILNRFEQRVRSSAEDFAWENAKRVADQYTKEWSETYGQHASEHYVAEEICHKLAHDLERWEPVFTEIHDDWVSETKALQDLSSTTSALLWQWALAVGREQAHKVWREAAYFADHRAASMAREFGLSENRSWEETRGYAAVAAEVSRILARDFDRHIHH